MANDKHPLFNGPFIVDCQSLNGILIDAASGATRGCRREKEDWDKANHEMLTRLPIHAAALRLAPDLDTQLAALNTRIAEVRALKLAAAKLVEVAEETEVVLEDEREGIVSLVVEAARKAAKRTDPGLMVSFEETIRYHGQLGRRAAQTRRKNARAAAEESEAEVQGSPTA